MQVIITNKEVNSIETTIRTVFSAAKEIVPDIPDDVDEFVDKWYEELDSSFDDQGNLVLNIKEEFFLTYMEIISDFYQLGFKVAKIVIPTVELVMSSCAEDIYKLGEKIGKLQGI